MPSSPARPRHFLNNASTLRTLNNVEHELFVILERLIDKYPPTTRLRECLGVEEGTYGLDSGTAGLAYTFMNAHKERPHLVVAGKACREWARLYLGLDPFTDEASPANCGILCDAVCHPAVYAAFHSSMEHVDILLSFLPSILDPNWEPAEGSSRSYEHCRGLGGYLYLLRLVRTWYPEAATRVSPAIDTVVESILAAGPPWPFVGEVSWLDASHGEIGIITQLVLSSPKYAKHPTVRQVFSRVLDGQGEDGDWRRPSASEATPVQWCNGAPGIIQCIVLLAPHFSDLADRINTAVQMGRAFVWEFGLLVKEPCLCHGISGNAFTFPPGPQRDHFLSFTTDEEVRAGLESGEYEKCDYGMGYNTAFGLPSRATAWLYRDRDAATVGRGCFVPFDDI